jgi:hypothetical protein
MILFVAACSSPAPQNEAAPSTSSATVPTTAVPETTGVSSSTSTQARPPTEPTSTMPQTAISTTTTTTTTPSSTSTVAPSTTTTAPPEARQLSIEVVTRDAWGAKPPDRELTPHAIEVITIHHTARSHDETPMEARLRGWQNYHQSIGFGDIAYHMVIGADGTIYEGRNYNSVGSTRTDYDPTGHFLPVLDGMFDEYWDNPNDDDEEPDGADELSRAQLGSLIDLLAWAVQETGVDPIDITGHNDHAATACPGSVVSDMIHSGEIASLVQQRTDAYDIELSYLPG